ncbi:MAG: peptidoglycan DD-metalloendopeptidase family protein [Deltaproteobacteria bacterium]|nr:peptidoglycan DD-metalloendopeptidase family protein [Deltaproteobacteria bacterium]
MSARTLVLVLVATVALGLAVSPGASAQSVRYRRPFEEGHRLNYGFDHDGGGGGCQDYACSGACYDGHTGSDFGAPLGTTLVAAAPGRVSATHDGCADYGGLGNTCGGRCGNYVQIDHDDGSRSIYCHMRRGSLRVSTGDRVGCGDVVGQSASSGNSTGPHLHFGHRSPGASSSSDPFAGRCGRSTSLWREQRDYREAPSTSCGCTPSAESCNGRDDDCDGRADEDVSRACSTACGGGREVCSGGAWGACDAPRPSGETCNGRDDDCDGTVDEDVCDRMSAEPSALPDALDLGQSSAFTLVVANTGTTTWRPGVYSVRASAEGANVRTRGAIDADVAPGAAIEVQVTLTPREEGDVRASVTVSHDGHDLEGTWHWDTTARRPVFGVRFVDVSLPSTLVAGERATGWVIVANEGREPWPAEAQVTTREGPAGGRIVGGTTGVVAPGAQARVSLSIETAATSAPRASLERTLVVRDAEGHEASWPDPARAVVVALRDRPRTASSGDATAVDPDAGTAGLDGGCTAAPRQGHRATRSGLGTILLALSTFVAATRVRARRALRRARRAR